MFQNVDNLEYFLDVWNRRYLFDKIVLGNGTSSEDRLNSLKDKYPIELVEEKGTTLRARNRYWELNPPSIWIRWIPKSLLLPPENLDALAALVILEDHLQKKLSWKDLPDFKTLLLQ